MGGFSKSAIKARQRCLIDIKRLLLAQLSNVTRRAASIQQRAMGARHANPRCGFNILDDVFRIKVQSASFLSLTFAGLEKSSEAPLLRLRFSLARSTPRSRSWRSPLRTSAIAPSSREYRNRSRSASASRTDRRIARRKKVFDARFSSAFRGGHRAGKAGGLTGARSSDALTNLYAAHPVCISYLRQR